MKTILKELNKLEKSKQRLSLWILLTFSLWCSSAHALYLSSDVFVIDADQSFLSRQFLNDSKLTNMYFINVYQIDRPGKAEVTSPIHGGEIMYTPLRIVVGPGQFEYFKVFYSGPKDEQERYYRMQIREVPLHAIKDQALDKDLIVSTIVALDTYLVVRPRKEVFSYHYDEVKGVLTNTGNTFFTVNMNQGCLAENDDNAEVFNLLPGQTSTHALLKGRHKKFIVIFNQYKQLGSQCFEESMS